MQKAIRDFGRFPWPLVAVLGLIVALTASAGSTTFAKALHPAPGVFTDETLYQTTTARVQAGEDYYHAAAAEHRAHGYPTRPAVTIREPTTTWLMVALRSDLVRWAAVLALATFTAFAMHRALKGLGWPAPVRVTALTLVAMGLDAGAPSAPYVADNWAGLLICSSLALWRPKRFLPSVALAFAACLFRELAAPVLLVMAGFAVVERRWREAFAWCVATAAFGALVSVHLWFAGRQALPTDLASQGWTEFGGWRFILATARRNVALIFLPNAVLSTVVALALLGHARAAIPWSRRIAAVTFAFVGLFWFVGRSANDYWGTLYAPLLPLGLLNAPGLLRDLAEPLWRSWPRLQLSRNAG